MLKVAVGITAWLILGLVAPVIAADEAPEQPAGPAESQATERAITEAQPTEAQPEQTYSNGASSTNRRQGMVGQFYYRVKRNVTKFVTEPYLDTEWWTYWVYDPQTCSNVQQRYPVQVTKYRRVPKTTTEYETVCKTLRVDLSTLQNADECHCDDLPDCKGSSQPKAAASAKNTSPYEPRVVRRVPQSRLVESTEGIEPVQARTRLQPVAEPSAAARQGHTVNRAQVTANRVSRPMETQPVPVAQPAMSYYYVPTQPVYTVAETPVYYTP